MNPTIKARLTDARAEETTESEVRALGLEVARRARAARYPKKSLSAVEREALKAGVDPELLRIVLETAFELLNEEALPPEGKRPPTGLWLTPLEAASALGVPPRWVLDRLDTAEGRRHLGYPWFDGRRWHVPAAACDSNTRSQYLADLPESEPAENVALLQEPD